ncbi:serine protease snake-like isoform X1 [Colias croceus]|uniref:serine protease snake-like isoform X1 n=1 Tax=Colias crocea TaxID=72248 RepID=UPI001E27E335|nr:serine protease snake-like isoform X1 [Colias croceus]
MTCFIVLLVIANVLCVNFADAGLGRRRVRQYYNEPMNYTFCETPLPPKPDFSAPGRRISEAKCFEYIWELKQRADKELKEDICNRYEWDNVPAIIHGHITKPGEYPHMAAIGWKAAIGTWIFKCGSTLISTKHLLTAAHCSRASKRDTSLADPVPKIVRLGDKNIVDVFTNGRFPYDVPIEKIINHPNFVSPKKYFDIAIIVTEREITFSNLIQPACLWNSYDTSKFSKEATVTGWGVIETAGKTTSPELQAATVDIIDSNHCSELLHTSCNRLWCGLQSHQLCAGKLEGGVDTCQGDSGGPLQAKIPLPVTTQSAMHFIIGVTSFGMGCARANLPGVYTRVSSFVDWIEDVVWRGL